MTTNVKHGAAHDASGYRPDVDGLRAIAVTSVILYHGFPSLFPGGFAGVDVFFVISGFLITGIILDDLRRDTFTFANFYARRVRRIFPALIAVLAATLVAGAILLLPGEFAQLGKHAASGALFVSNVALLREINYFDTAAELKPLLHLWSLAVEEQYYLIWPVILLATRNRLKWGLWLCAVIALASFGLNIGLVERQPSATFYLPFTRFWELMLGSALAYGRRWPAASASAPDAASARAEAASERLSLLREFSSVAGAGLLVLTIAQINTQRAFPGWWALLPTVGTVMVISAGPQAWINRSVLSARWMVLIGVISFPLYLWHWPLLAFGRIVAGQLSGTTTILLIVLGGALAWLTYRYIEVKIRFHRGQRHPRRAVHGALAAMCVVAAVGMLSATAILRPIDATSAVVTEVEAASKDWMRIEELTIQGGDRTVLFFGDSHMQQYAPRVVQAMSDQARPRKTVEFMTRGGCAPFPGLERRGQGCAAFVRRGFEHANMPNVDTIVVAASWYGFTTRDDYRPEGQDGAAPLQLRGPGNQWVFDGFEIALRSLVQKGKRVVIVLSSPRGERLRPQSWVERSVTGKRRHMAEPLLTSDLQSLVSSIDDRIRSIASRIGATVVEPIPALCTNECPALDEAGKFIYIDDSHLRASFVRKRFELFDRFLLPDELPARNDPGAGPDAWTAVPAVGEPQQKEKS
jgi:peptidoglycan/LPS O-acetylase OafA/YrhL